MTSQDKTISFAYRPGNEVALVWEKKITRWLKKNYPNIKVVGKNGKITIVLGGDGTILETARRQNNRSLIFGLNLGRVGFLASVRESKNFLGGLGMVLNNKYSVAKRMMLQVNVIRDKKIIFTTNALNEVVVQSLMGMVELELRIDGDLMQNIRGTGALVSTATGSTAYNLSAHGPIMMPDINGFIVTELMDHNIPSPSIIIKRNKNIQLKVKGFRERGLLSISETGEKVDVILVADGTNLFSLKKKDRVSISHSPKLVSFIELEKNYFFKSLQEKFTFK